MQVSVTNAKKKLPQLIKAVEAGRAVTICRRGMPVADLVRPHNGPCERPRFGTLRGKFVVFDPDWWKPMTGSEAKGLPRFGPRDFRLRPGGDLR